MTDDEKARLETAKWYEELRLRDAERAHDRLDDFISRIYRAAIESGQLTLRMALLINGGAAVAVLAFLSAIVSKDPQFDVDNIAPLATALIWFAVGAALTVFAMAAGYFANFCDGTAASVKTRTFKHPYVEDTPESDKWERWAVRFQYASVLVATLAVLAFFGGIVATKVAVTELATRKPAVASRVGAKIGPAESTVGSSD